MIAQAQKESEPQPPVGQTSFGSSIDPRGNQSDVYRRRTTDGDPFLFGSSAGPVRASVSGSSSNRANQMSPTAAVHSHRSLHTSTPPFNRTARSPYHRQTPPNHTQRVSTTIYSQNQTTNLLFLLLLLLLFGRGGTTTATTSSASSGSSSSPSSTRGNL